MNRELIEKANLQTFHGPQGLSPADYVLQEMATRGGGYEPASLRVQKCRILAAESLNGLALCFLMRQLDKDDPTKQGFVTIAVDLTGEELYRTGTDGTRLPKSAKTGYREFGDISQKYAHDNSLVIRAIQRECDTIATRHHFLTSLLDGIPQAANDDSLEEQEDDPATPTHAGQDRADAVQEPHEDAPVARTASNRSRSRAQGNRRE